MRDFREVGNRKVPDEDVAQFQLSWKRRITASSYFPWLQGLCSELWGSVPGGFGRAIRA